MSQIFSPREQPNLDLKKLRWLAPLSGLLASIDNAVVYFITVKLMHLTLLVPGKGGDLIPLQLFHIVIACVAAGIGAGILLTFLMQRTEHPLRPFILLSCITLGLSFYTLIAFQMDITTRGVLALMHCIAAAWIIGVCVFFMKKRNTLPYGQSE
ncbi:MAG TPA: DUF6069 family protein [Candidatus Kapabacteria bacterium]|nr:DUF6069 family protein [Candidatus Kapabacteria bacterium]